MFNEILNQVILNQISFLFMFKWSSLFFVFYNTPLSFAIEKRYRDVMIALLSHKSIDVNIKVKTTRTIKTEGEQDEVRVKENSMLYEAYASGIDEMIEMFTSHPKIVPDVKREDVSNLPEILIDNESAKTVVFWFEES